MISRRSLIQGALSLSEGGIIVPEAYAAVHFGTGRAFTRRGIGSGVEPFDPATTDSNVTLSSDLSTATKATGVGTTSKAGGKKPASGGLASWTFTVGTAASTIAVGLATSTVPTTGFPDGTTGKSVIYRNDGTVWKDGVQVVTGYPSYFAGDQVTVTIDTATNKVWFARNGFYQGVAGTSGEATTASVGTYYAAIWLYAVGDSVTLSSGGATGTIPIRLAGYKNSGLSGTTTITRSSAASVWKSGFINCWRGAGKYWFEYRVRNRGTGGAAGAAVFGVTNISQAVADGNWIGDNSTGISHSDDGRILRNNAVLVGANATMALAVDEWGMACIDIANGLFWFSAGGRNWNNDPTANPATGVGGYTQATNWALYGPYLPGVSLFYPNSQMEVNFTTPQSRTAPSGFSAWPARQRGYKPLYCFNVSQVIPNNAQWPNACEIEMRNASGVDLTSPAGTNAGQKIAASSYNTGAPVWSPDKAFNNDNPLSAGWMASGLVPQSLYYYDGDDRDLSAAQTLYYVPRADTYDGYWQAFALQYANPDEAAFWITQKSYSNLNLTQGQTATLAAY